MTYFDSYGFPPGEKDPRSTARYVLADDYDAAKAEIDRFRGVLIAVVTHDRCPVEILRTVNAALQRDQTP